MGTEGNNEWSAVDRSVSFTFLERISPETLIETVDLVDQLGKQKWDFWEMKGSFIKHYMCTLARLNSSSMYEAV